APPLSWARCANGLRASWMNINVEGNGRWSGDGWIADWRFSEKAYEISFSADCRRVRWKEQADSAGVGVLLSATIPNGVPLRLGRNVGTFAEQPDGRLLVHSNLVGLPEAERLLLVDEDAKVAHWLLDGTQP